ncbi:hypothetical protein X566_05455 [Afipia sp. P52-10]|nr:hypothetical protein X566_05455 [Afipia sp. P52-10]
MLATALALCRQVEDEEVANFRHLATELSACPVRIGNKPRPQRLRIVQMPSVSGSAALRRRAC